MKYKMPSPADLLKKSFGIVIILLLSLVIFSCNNKAKTPKGDPLKDAIRGMDPRDSLWASWNVLLKPGTDRAARSAAILWAESKMKDDFNGKFNSSYALHLAVYYCPCDSLLYNIGAKVINGSGQSVTTPPPPPPPNGSGDALFVSNNNRTDNTIDNLALKDTTYKMALAKPLRQSQIGSKILAVIDTGLDTFYFSDEVSKLIWKGEGDRTIYNVVDVNSNSLYDDHPDKHGTIVTAVAMKALKDQNNSFDSEKNHLPRLMILKALNKKKRGSTFTVSCALSYAVQHQAAVVNASLGYYGKKGEVDSIFRHYIGLCKTQTTPIAIFAAAGNLPISTTSICDPGTADKLSGQSFYPGCFSTDFNNVFTITTLTNPRASCFYQNYSSVYVSLGILQTNSANCCHFSVPFANANGTSFATPVAAGTGLSYILNGHTVDEFMRSVSRESSSVATKEGKYFKYRSN